MEAWQVRIQSIQRDIMSLIKVSSTESLECLAKAPSPKCPMIVRISKTCVSGGN